MKGFTCGNLEIVTMNASLIGWGQGGATEEQANV